MALWSNLTTTPARRCATGSRRCPWGPCSASRTPSGPSRAPWGGRSSSLEEELRRTVLSLLGGRFALVREIGSGGMSTVYLGRDEVLDRPVAVKILNPELEGSDVSSRFRREGRTAARLSHPNVVQVYDAGEDELDGHEVSYIVVEYLQGGDLKDLIDRRGPLPGAMLARIGADVADGLAHAHERGIVHRDIKPQNVLLDQYGSPKLTDFGIARALDMNHSTSTDSYLGTAFYSSPEQLRGEGVTPKSDVYSLGATLYHAAVGEPPFSGDPLQVATQQVAKTPVPPRARGAAVVARAAGAAGVKAVKRGWSRRNTPELPGPPEITISLPTRTFRAGSRQRMTLAAFLFALFLIALAAIGSWTLLDRNAVEEPGPLTRIVEPQLNYLGPPTAARQGNAKGRIAATGNEPAAQEEPALPLQGAEQAVFDMYYQESFARAEESWSFLSSRLQSEIGSVDQWAEQEDIYTFTYMEFTSYPAAAASGRSAEVAFEVRLDHTWGSELLSGTWVCVVENGEWKLDHLENETSTLL